MASKTNLIKRSANITLLILIIEIAWSLGTPLFSGPDEPTQAIKAASVARLELAIHPVSTSSGPYTRVVVPKIFTQSANMPLCYMFNPAQSANCEGPFPPLTSPSLSKASSASSASSVLDANALVTTQTYVGRYPPLYYLLVSWPARYFHSPFGFYLIRIMSDLVSSIVLGVALALALELDTLDKPPSKSYLYFGGLLAMTPALEYSSSVINPNGLEAAAGLGLWICLIGMKRCHEHKATPNVLVRQFIFFATICACVETLMRGLSPLWVFITCAIGCLYYGWSLICKLARIRYVRICSAFVFFANILSSIYIVWAKTLHIAGAKCIHNCPTFIENAHKSFGKTWLDIHQLIGTVGWIDLINNKLASDTSIPDICFWLLFGSIAILGLLFLWNRKPNRPALLSPAHNTLIPPNKTASSLNEKFAFLLLIASVIFLPVVLEASQANNYGFIWQGRYVLPIALGIPIIALSYLDDNPRLRTFIQFIASTDLIVIVISYYAIIRRYSVGIHGPIWFFRSSGWSPPVSSVTLILVFTIANLFLYKSVIFTPSPRSASDTALAPASFGR